MAFPRMEKHKLTVELLTSKWGGTMTLTALEIKDKSFGTKFRGYDVEEVDEFMTSLSAIKRTWFVKTTKKKQKFGNLEERSDLFWWEWKTLSASLFWIAQDTAERVEVAANERSTNIVRQAEQDAQHLLMELSTRLMRFYVRQLTMLRK